MRNDVQQMILDALTRKPRTTRELADICSCATGVAEWRCSVLAGERRIRRSGNGRWCLTRGERGLRPEQRLTEAHLVPVYEELRARDSVRSAGALAKALGLRVDDVQRRLASLKSQGLVSMTRSGKGWELTKTSAICDPYPFRPSWPTPNVGLFG